MQWSNMQLSVVGAIESALYYYRAIYDILDLILHLRVLALEADSSFLNILKDQVFHLRLFLYFRLHHWY